MLWILLITLAASIGILLPSGMSHGRALLIIASIGLLILVSILLVKSELKSKGFLMNGNTKKEMVLENAYLIRDNNRLRNENNVLKDKIRTGKLVHNTMGER